MTNIEKLRKLNSERTQGGWVINKEDYIGSFFWHCGEDKTQFTALAVNNFMQVVEALQQIANLHTPASNIAQQALNNIKL